MYRKIYVISYFVNMDLGLKKSYEINLRYIFCIYGYRFKFFL